MSIYLKINDSFLSLLIDNKSVISIHFISYLNLTVYAPLEM